MALDSATLGSQKCPAERVCLSRPVRGRASEGSPLTFLVNSNAQVSADLHICIDGRERHNACR